MDKSCKAAISDLSVFVFYRIMDRFSGYGFYPEFPGFPEAYYLEESQGDRRRRRRAEDEERIESQDMEIRRLRDAQRRNRTPYGHGFGREIAEGEGVC